MTPLASENMITDGARRTVEAVIARLADSRAAAAVAIVVVSLLSCLPGLTGLPPLDREEAYVAEAARQMVATGHLMDTQIVGEPRPLASIGTVWLAAGAGWLAGGDPPIWVYRIPPLLAGMAAALLSWWLALALVGRRAALLAGLFVAANMILAAEAKIARPDAALLATIVLADGALARLWLSQDDRRRPGLCLLFWVSVGLGVLLKGAVAPAMVAATLLLLALGRRSLGWMRRLQPWWGVPLMLVIAAPEIASVLVAAGRDAGGGLPAGLAGAFNPLAPPGTYTILFPALFWPGATFFLLAVPWLFDERRRPAVLFAAACAAPAWIGAELIAYKLPQLVLPAFPAIALLAGLAVDAGQTPAKGRVRGLISLWLPFFGIAVFVSATAIVYGIDAVVPYTAMVPLGIAAALGIVAWRWLRAEHAVAAAGLAVIAATIMNFGVLGLILPGLEHTRLSDRVLDLGKSLTCGAPRYASAGYVEPSLAFLTKSTVRFVTATEAADFLNQGPCRVAIVENRQLSSFRQRADDLGITLDVLGRVPGFNPGNGRWVNLRLFTLAKQQGGNDTE
jgi:4-amino-4-deoxy-L-arabinose transferase-like glycosyltransferase